MLAVGNNFPYKNLVAGTHPQLRVKVFSFRGKSFTTTNPPPGSKPSVSEPSALTSMYRKEASGPKSPFKV